MSDGIVTIVSCYLKVEERIECVVSKKVRYSKRDDTILTLPVPLEAATNKGEPH
jgi:ubiquitin carboxyl-terminal hydrolase 5/13